MKKKQPKESKKIDDTSRVPEEHINPVNGLQQESMFSAHRKKINKKDLPEETLPTPSSPDSAR